MADSENSKTLPAITRRKMLFATTAYLTALTDHTAHNASRPFDDQGNTAARNVLALWRVWYDAHEEAKRLCHQQQRLETEVLKSAGGFPVIKLEIPGEDRPVVVQTCAQIDVLLPGDAMAEARKTAKTELAARLQKWNTADEQFGYSRTQHAETQIARVEETLAKSLWEAPAFTTSDIIAKLHAIIETEDPGSHFKERPWPQLRMILADLVCIERSA
ncbi:hypothetical protein [Rhizobium ruizarguesonis]|uniref:hypothetical protein n=1 Tax=Rhizobium ruizarguesonis TaxID=2081791 RepID=UPI0013BC592A|nr:hypothetical protein [Rhizobium ruizarguesonis]NEJ64906.1 hypothetical protein [Rhizobium ruizarguesonis]